MLILTHKRGGGPPVPKPNREKFNSRSDIYSSQYESFNNYKSLLENSNYMMTPSDLGTAGDKYARGGLFGSSLSPEQMGYSRFRVPDPEGEGKRDPRAHRACRQSAGHRKHHGQISVSAFRRAEAAGGLCARRRHAAKPHPGG